jgi:hypothetical protein
MNFWVGLVGTCCWHDHLLRYIGLKFDGRGKGGDTSIKGEEPAVLPRESNGNLAPVRIFGQAILGQTHVPSADAFILLRLQLSEPLQWILHFWSS